MTCCKIRITRPFKVRARPYTPGLAKANVITPLPTEKVGKFLRLLNYPLASFDSANHHPNKEGAFDARKTVTKMLSFTWKLLLTVL